MKLEFLTASLAKVGLAGLALAFLIPTIPRAVGATNDPPGKSVYEVTGHVSLFDGHSARSSENGSEVVAWLVPMGIGQKTKLNNGTPHYQMMQHHKMFEPRLLVVPTGSIVEFPNHDPWFHNVFSVSRNSRFDLGLYEAGAKKAVKFDRAGASYLFCKIHPGMMAVVLTVDSTYFGISDKTGHITIDNVPPGKYFLHVWYGNAAPQVLEAQQRAILVGNDSHRLPAISITLSNRSLMTSMSQEPRLPDTLRKRQTPDQGREPCSPVDSGSNESRRIQGVSRFSRAAVFSMERTSMGDQP